MVEYLYADRDNPCPRCKSVPFKTSDDIHKVVAGVLQNTLVKCDFGVCKGDKAASIRLEDYGKHVSMRHLPCPYDCDYDKSYTLDGLA